ncbi:hypothetical protein M2360_000854 [Rhizobium sp. SG_E_25_P2]|uniref:hypothetical protein n=1 Tax=Rhizobium sp. SG_E_25_P2 TaxID=2879942 RepID=UPI0024737BFD|nr:hypothetical protein [Rhizobium sp. SG_E_25_P2]MDH6265464.1 hypothetical protein [Rhizobium sp. SG_E_25_P2]
MKIGLPKIRFSKKLAIISAGMLALLGGTGGAALYVGKDELLGPPKVNTTGGECQTIQTMVLKTPGKRLWMRKYVKMASADADMRIKTALRVAGLLAKTNKVDLIQVSILDDRGPDKRAFMRGRAIGAEVVIALQPRYVPEMKQPFIARYYDGLPADDGRFYGERVELDAEEVKAFMAAMKDEPDKLDCADIPKPEPTEGEKPAHGAAKPEHGATVSEGHAAPAAEGHGEEAKTEGHGEEAPAEGHGEKTAEGHGETPAGEEAKAEGHGEEPAKEPSMMDSVLGMVGLGGGEEKPAEGHDASKNTEGEAAPAEEGHETASAKPEPSMMDSMLGMVGLGGEEKPAADHGPAKTEGEHAPAEEPADTAEGDHAQPAGDHGAAGEHDASVDQGDAAHAAPADEAKAGDHGASEAHEAQPAEDHSAAEDHAAPAEDHAAPAEEHGAASEAGHAAEGAAKPEAHGQAETAHEPAPAEDHAAAPAEEGHGDTTH